MPTATLDTQIALATPQPSRPSGLARLARWVGLGGLGLALFACAPMPPTPGVPTVQAAPSPARQQPPAFVTDAPARLAQLNHPTPSGHPDLLLLGEQHDAPEHQQWHLAVVQALARQHVLAAVVLEMADAGHDTRALPPSATDAQVRQALAWSDDAWPWASYGPVVMAAVRAGVPVLGGNLPRSQNAQVMRQPEWDTRVPAQALATQREAVEDSHCGLLPATQIAPMTRIQIARDARLADTLAQAAVPGQTVLLLSGSQHTHRALGVPLHLPATLSVKAVRLDASGPRADDAAGFDAVWPTPVLPAVDHCAELKARWSRH